MQTDVLYIVIMYSSALLGSRNVAHKFVQNIETHILCSVTFSENLAVCEIMWKKYGRAGQATGDNTAPALFVLDKKYYRRTLRIRNAYCFSMATKLRERV